MKAPQERVPLLESTVVWRTVASYNLDTVLPPGAGDRMSCRAFGPLIF